MSELAIVEYAQRQAQMTGRVYYVIDCGGTWLVLSSLPEGATVIFTAEPGR